MIVLRGAGRSYGDAAIAAEAIVLDCTRMNRILCWDPATGIIECEGGATIEDLWRHCLEDGWWPPVVSGTMYPTIAGALAMNIHGKNNFRVGTFGDHVLEIEVLTPSGETLALSPSDERFFAVIGSFGTLGFISKVKLQMKRVDSGDLRVLATSPQNWEEQFQAFEAYEAGADYMVSWIDCFGRGDSAGRGQFHAAWYLHPSLPDALSLRADRQDLPDTVLGILPKSQVWHFLKVFNNRIGMHFINWAKYTASRKLGDGKSHFQGLVAFSFLLDYVPGWRNAYLPDGFIQYQSFVPKDRAASVFARQIEIQQEERMESFLGVMKRHRPDNFLLTHAVDGYSLALDFKVRRGSWDRLEAMCHRMNDLVLEAGGRFYMAKDSTLRPLDVRQFLGEDVLARLGELKAKMDPAGLFTSSLVQRLNLFT